MNFVRCNLVGFVAVTCALALWTSHHDARADIASEVKPIAELFETARAGLGPCFFLIDGPNVVHSRVTLLAGGESASLHTMRGCSCRALIIKWTGADGFSMLAFNGAEIDTFPVAPGPTSSILYFTECDSIVFQPPLSGVGTLNAGMVVTCPDQDG